MLITLSFNEIKSIIFKKTNNRVNLDFSYVSRDIIKVSYKHVAFLPAVGINLKIDEINNSRACLSYETNNAIEMVIKGLVTFLDNNIPKEIVELNTYNQQVMIHLNKIEQLQKPLEMMEIQDVYFEDGNISAEVKLNI